MSAETHPTQRGEVGQSPRGEADPSPQPVEAAALRVATEPALREVAAPGLQAVTELTLRAATEADLDFIWAIEASVFGAEAWSREMMREELTADHRAYFALEDASGAVQGYGGLLAVGTEGDIQTIAIAPELRGTGQGRRMMRALLDAARERGVREVFLEVRADNPVAISLYRSLGFEEIGVRPRYYQPDNVDAIVMRVALKGTP